MAATTTTNAGQNTCLSIGADFIGVMLLLAQACYSGGLTSPNTPFKTCRKRGSTDSSL